MQKVASLNELDGEQAIYSFIDVMKMNAWLDFKADFEGEATNDSKRVSNKTRI